MQLIDGKAISEQVKQEIAAEVAEIVANGGKRPHLAAILVGHDGGSETYVAAKVKACEVCGFKSTLIRYEADVTEEELLAKVKELNEDTDVDGFIVQLPLPKHISEQKVIETIDYRKDVDIDDNAFKSIEAIIYSMTPEERTRPEILNGSRRQRIAKGSGTNIQEVNRLLKQFEQTRKMMKMVTGSKMGKMMMPKLKR